MESPSVSFWSSQGDSHLASTRLIPIASVTPPCYWCPPSTSDTRERQSLSSSLVLGAGEDVQIALYHDLNYRHPAKIQESLFPICLQTTWKEARGPSPSLYGRLPASWIGRVSQPFVWCCPEAALQPLVLNCIHGWSCRAPAALLQTDSTLLLSSLGHHPRLYLQILLEQN